MKKDDKPEDILKKSDLIIQFSEKNNISIKRWKAFDIIISEITNALAKGYRAEFRGFGIFSPSIRQARKARNPKTGEDIKVKNYHSTFRLQKIFLKNKWVDYEIDKTNSSFFVTLVLLSFGASNLEMNYKTFTLRYKIKLPLYLFFYLSLSLGVIITSIYYKLKNKMITIKNYFSIDTNDLNKALSIIKILDENIIFKLGMEFLPFGYEGIKIKSIKPKVKILDLKLRYT